MAIILQLLIAFGLALTLFYSTAALVVWSFYSLLRVLLGGPRD